jgi:fibronectin-binding autotransporter adhesin
LHLKNQPLFKTLMNYFYQMVQEHFNNPTKSLVLILGIILFSNIAFGQTTYYSRSSGLWSDPANWSTVSHTSGSSLQSPGGNINTPNTDIVIIAAEHVITLDTDTRIGGLTVGTTAFGVTEGTLIIGESNTARTLVVNGAVHNRTSGVIRRNLEPGLPQQGQHFLEIMGDNGHLTNDGLIEFADTTITSLADEYAAVDVIFHSGGNINIAGTATRNNSIFNAITIDKPNREITLGSNWTAVKQLYIKDGALVLGTASDQPRTINGLLAEPPLGEDNILLSSTIRIEENGKMVVYEGFPESFNKTLLGTSGTIEFAKSSGGAQILPENTVVEAFENVVLSGANNKRLGSETIINKNLSIITGSTNLNFNGNTLRIRGNFLHNGNNLIVGSDRLILDGNENQTITREALGNFSIGRMEIIKPEGTYVRLYNDSNNTILNISNQTFLTSGALDLGVSTGHTLGTVTGNGTLAISAAAGGTTSFPSGTFTDFLNTGNGVIEYYSNHNIFIGTAPLNYAHLLLTGTGTKIFNSNTTITKNLTIGTDAVLNSGTLGDNRTFTVTGNIINHGSVNGFGTFILNNTTANQSISGSQPITLYNLTLQKASGFELTLARNLRINNTLDLQNEGNIFINKSDLRISATGRVTGAAGGETSTAFGPTRMIRQDGTNAFEGRFIKEGTETSHFIGVYPVGTGTVYTYAELTLLDASIAGTGSLAIKAIPLVTANIHQVRKYWRVQPVNINAITDARIQFKYDETELHADGEPTSVSRFANETENPVTGAFIDLGQRFFGVNASGNEHLELEWKAGDISSFAKTYYSYQSGSWESPNTWTTDPTGTILQGQPATGGPDNGDRVFILSGRNISITTNDKLINSLNLEAGSALNIGNTSGHNFSRVTGSGLLRSQTTELPDGDYTEFTSLSGGTIEYYDYVGALGTRLTQYNNLIFSGSGDKILGPDAGPYDPVNTYTILGNLTIAEGTLTIGSAASNQINLEIQKNLMVSNGASLRVSTHNNIHEIYIYGDFTNNGNVLLSNSAQYATANNGAANVIMRGASDNVVNGSGERLDFYRFIIDKGVDKTYVLDVNPQVSGAGFTSFRLLGPTGLTNGSTSSPFSNENPEIRKALWVRNGTLKLGSNVNIPRLSSGGNDIFIPENGAIWIDGAQVASTDLTGTGNTALTLFGRLRVTAGEWRGNGSVGIVYRTISELVIEGGSVNISQFRPSVADPQNNRSGFLMSGGELIVHGSTETSNDYALFHMDKVDGVFSMTGGTLRVLGATNTGSIDIRVASSNFNVTGGTIELEINPNRDHTVRSTAPFYNFHLIRGDRTNPMVLTNGPLMILNDLHLGSETTLSTTNHNVSIGRNFIIEGTYNAGTNTTILNGTTSNQTVESPSATTFNHLHINNTFTNGIVSLGGSGTFTVNGNFQILSGTFEDGGKNLTVGRNLHNAGTHTGSGSIRLNSGLSTPAIISGNGQGVFSNLHLDDTDGYILTANTRINGNLNLAQGNLNIGIYNLRLLEDATLTITSPSSSKMITTNGNQSDGGLTKVITAAGTYLFPVGTGSNYTPTSITIHSADEFGSITVSPTNMQHPFVATGEALNYYWKVKSTGFSGNKDITAEFTYTNSLIHDGVNDSEYIAAFYVINDPTSWEKGVLSDVNKTSKTISYTNVPFLEGDYTAGEDDAFGIITAFYSRNTGDWEDPNTWSTSGHAGGPAGAIPSANNPVFIGNGNGLNHIITTTADNATSGAMVISQNSILDIGITKGHNFGALVEQKVLGNGRLRISHDSDAAEAQFPDGDFGQFLGAEGGTVEYYTTTSSFFLPLNIPFYNNLEFSCVTNHNIRFRSGYPGNKLLIHGNMTIHPRASGAHTAARVEVTQGASNAVDLDIKGDLNVNGLLRYSNNTASTIEVHGNVVIGSTGQFFVRNGGTAVPNFLFIYGNLQNEGILDLSPGSNFFCNTYFSGLENAQITGTGATTRFHRLILDKGSSIASILEVDTDNFTLAAPSTGSEKALDLRNGTFKLNSNQEIIISSGNNGFNYLIPTQSRLWVDGGSVRITSTGANAGLLVAGTLQVTSGSISIEGGGSNNNFIEYAGAGSPTIRVEGGELRVGSQIRRSLTSTIGALRYIQTGGEVVIGTQSAPASNRSLLEVLNPGSRFEMSGGTLVIARPQASSPSTPALYLQPSTHAVSGGKILLGSDNGAHTPLNSNITVHSNFPLYNVEINNVNNPEVTLAIGTFAVENNMVINSGSTLHSAGFPLHIQGDFEMNGTYNTSGNTTHFNGTRVLQTLTASSPLTLHHVTIANTNTDGIVAFEAQVTIANILTLSSGTLDSRNTPTYLHGRLNNFSRHINSQPGGKLVFNGAQTQVLSGDGNGVLGNIEINNPQGLSLEEPQTINGTITFTSGVLNIGSRGLTLGAEAGYDGSPGLLSHIRTNGTLGDQGITKVFDAGGFDFTFPIGSGGKYTPARFIATPATGAGSITIRPVNRRHPSTSDGSILRYYWNVTSSGLDNINIRHIYNYDQADVLGDEALYSAARFNNSWTFGSSIGSIDDGSNLIHIEEAGPSGVNFINGDYTTGYEDMFNVIDTFVSLQSGLWNDATTWVENQIPSNGSSVTIASGHEIAINLNDVALSSLEIASNARVTIENTTFGHNLGAVRGTGTLALSGSLFPGGDFSQFTSNNGGTVEYSGGSYTLPTQQTYNHLILNSSGILNHPAAVNIQINGNFTIASGTFANPHNQNLLVRRNWTNNGTFSSGTGTVTFTGNQSQTLGGSSGTVFHNLRINKTSNNLSVNDLNITVNNLLTLTNGNINMSPGREFHAGNTFSFSRINGHINGIIVRNVSSSNATFPVGVGNAYLPVTLSFSTGSSLTQVQVRNTNPVTEKGVGDASNPVNALWSIHTTAFPTGATAQAIFQYPDTYRPGGFAQNHAYAARWNTIAGEWQSFRLSSTPSPNENPSRVTVNGITGFSDWAIFSGENDTPLPVSLLYLRGVALEKANKIEWATVSETNNDYFVIERSENFTSFTEIGRVKGAGNSNAIIKYEFEDHALSSHSSLFYRLKQVDFDGSFEYSDIIKIDNEWINQARFSIYPNPSQTDHVKLVLHGFNNDAVNVKIYNMTGTLYFQQEIEALEPTMVHPINFNKKPTPGVYMVVLFHQGKFYKQKLIIQ